MRFNYYDILEISPFSPQHEITQAFDRAKQTYSGDNPAIYTMFSENEARELLKLVEEAYSVLGNKSLRALYDEKMGNTSQKKLDVSFEALKKESLTQQTNPFKRAKNFKAQFEVRTDMEQRILAQQDWAGEFLKEVREYKQITLEVMSEVTKITPFYIQSVEEMNPQHLPATVFIRGYVGQIAKMLQLDEKKVTDSYMKLYKAKNNLK